MIAEVDGVCCGGIEMLRGCHLPVPSAPLPSAIGYVSLHGEVQRQVRTGMRGADTDGIGQRQAGIWNITYY